MLKEFRDFAMRGNVLDMAVGVVIGAAFGVVVSSLVDDVIMPPIGVILGGVDFSNIFVVLKHGSPPGPYASVAAAKAAGAATWNIGLLINAVVKFLIVAFALFVLVKGFNRLRIQQALDPGKAPPPPRQEVLLQEIRDLLRAQTPGAVPPGEAQAREAKSL